MNAKDVIRLLFDKVLNGGDLARLEEIIGEDYEDHDPVPGLPPGVAGVRAKLGALRAAFGDLRFVLEALVAEGALVAARYCWTGRHTGAFVGIAPTGRAVRVTGMDFYRVREGRIVEHWHHVDELGLLRQLGSAPG